MRLYISPACLLLLLNYVVLSMAESDASASASAELIEAEHRSPKAEPFLERIASLFGGGGGATDKKGLPAGHRPVKKGPVYRAPKPPPPRRQSAAGSVQRPIAVSPPKSYVKKPFFNQQTPQRVSQATSASNISPVSQSASSFGSRFSGPSDPWKIAQPANMAQIKDLQVQCEKDLMRVRIIFDRPFYGMVFSKGHYSNVNCVHVPSGLGQTQATFDIAMGQCGMSTGGNSDSYNGAPSPQGSFIENTIIVQYDPLLQEVWDQARKMRCTWYDFYEKAVTFKPYQVDMLDPVTANFLGDNLRCWMQIQVGKGPYASEVSGIVKIGQTMTMVLGVKDDDNKFDMMVRNCVAHDGTRAPIQLVDEKGCVVRDKIMSPFKKMKNFDSTANVLSYAYFQAFKFPDSMNVHFQCVVQVCRGSCPDPSCGGSGGQPAVDGYGAPQAPAIDGYGAPGSPALNSYSSPGSSNADLFGDSYSGPGLSNRRVGSNAGLDPRAAGSNQGLYSAGSERRVSIVKPQGSLKPSPIPLKADTVNGYTNAHNTNQFQSRMGTAAVESNALGGGNPRSLDFEHGQPVGGAEARTARKSDITAAEEDTDSSDAELETDNTNSVVENEKEASRKRRATATVVPVDANGNRIIAVVRRRGRRAADADPSTLLVDSVHGSNDEADDEEVDQADIETERVIRVVAPSDVQFQLSDDESKEEVVINTNSSALAAESLCIDTAAFVGVTIAFIMLLIVALITIVFLWLRIRAIDRKNLL